MEIKKAREIVIEIERIRTTRKRCRTQMLFCPQCDSEADFISLKEAAALFEVDKLQLRAFIDHHLCTGAMAEDEILICLVSFLARMRTRSDQTGKTNIQTPSFCLLTDRG